MNDLFGNSGKKGTDYSAKDIEVLEGLEPVRRRPGMYIGGTDERAFHHLAAEILDNSMDEAVAGYATRIEVELDAQGFFTVRDNGRGIPIDPHPKYKGKSALEVILTTLHSGGKFSGKVYQTSGGLHGVGSSVVNALSDSLIVEVARDKQLYSQSFSRGLAVTKLTPQGPVNRRGTTVRFHPDPDIFGKQAHFKPARLYRMCRSKAYLFRGVEIRWSCDPSLIGEGETTPANDTLHFPGGLLDFLNATLESRKTITSTPFAGQAEFPDEQGRVEWAIAWPVDDDSMCSSYCNTVPTPEGGTHETGLRTGLLRSLKAYGDLIGNRKAAQITSDDITGGAMMLLSVFIRDPQFQGQTKEKLATAEAARLVEASIKDHFDHWLSGDPGRAKDLLERVIEKAEERLRKRQDKELTRKTATRRLRLPGKLADCTRDTANGTELFLVEGDSAGGSAKQARDRETQAVLPLRGKILNVASASADKLGANQELIDLIQALGCGTRDKYNNDKLRYEKVIIMTDADVDGAHIASLLMTFFYREMPQLIENGHLFLAQPPLYRLSQGGKSAYARDDAHKEDLLKKEFNGRGKVEISRFKGLGEMPAQQLKETTMDRRKRTLLKVRVPQRYNDEDRAEARETADLVERLMGRKPELRFQFIQENARFARDLDV
ncbi:DNA topoisomerase IV subunit B [Dongia soli]|uniref:DNA topoisomerase 4 subunit B n=1 Tax=Dongia soli TaxID=600628 RepID=A0ABU5EAH6_9PROT|nr:DNA topoisomerase IV subunit B [Dongia soli]MDY0883193.1 DNA topoisomerase IV subunit B [Dongia soli]